MQNYFIKIGNDAIPNYYIAPDSFQAYLEPLIAKEWEDVTGVRHVRYKSAKRLHIQFDTTSLTQAMLNEFVSIFTGNLNTRIVPVTAYVQELDDYVTQDCELSPLVSALHRKTVMHGNIYQPISVELNGLGGIV